jgi:cytochrome c553
LRLGLLIPALACISALAFADSASERLAVCLSCHGEGTSPTPEVPSLGGQPADFLLIQLYQFREKQRIAEPMNELAKDFSDDDLRSVSETLAKLPPPSPPADNPDTAKFDEGRAAAQKHRCGFCHNPDLSGHDQIGRIADQREDYLFKALTGYKSNERKGYDPAMNEVAQDLSEADIAALAYYVAHFR